MNHVPTASDVRRFRAQGVHVMAKPIGPICNLDCEYCYYLHKEDLYAESTSWRMPAPTLEAFIRQYIDAQPPRTPEITFAWQGGEPTLLGVEFFERVVEIQNKRAPKNVRIVNTLQTNGVLLDDEWCRLFRRNEFLIGLSIDGPAELHDRYRYDKKGRPTHEAVVRGLRLLKRYGVEFNALVVVNRHNGDHGAKIYKYLRDNGVRFIQFIPIVERRGVGVHGEPDLVELRSADEANHRSDLADGVASDPEAWDDLVSSRSVRPEQFGRFLIDVFEDWVRRDVGRVFVQIFDQALSAWSGVEPSLCVFRKQCGRALAIEHNGDLYSCDHFVEPEYLLGNIRETPIEELANSERQFEFGRDKESSLPEYCRRCEVRFACNGECPKNRFITTPDGEPGLNYLCAGYRAFFNHVDPYMRMMAEELKHRRPAANVMQRLNTQERGSQDATRRTTSAAVGFERSAVKVSQAVQGRPGRNDTCPCGSGQKFKKCCMQRGSV